ncbi:MAG: hypothetical protein AB7G25_09630, partial [Sphingomonadaceae bacterium]
FGTLFPSFMDAVPRPARQAGARYNQVSDAIWRTAHDVLSGNSRATPALAELEETLDRIRYRARWQ